MRAVSRLFSGSDGLALRGTIWGPDTDGETPALPQAVILIVHGMAEHHARYAHVAEFFVDKGCVVVGYDQRGHGATAGQPGSKDFITNFGFLSESKGWRVLVDDLVRVFVQCATMYPTVSLFVFGHSMGSLLSRAALTRYQSQGLSGIVLSGTAGDPGFRGRMGLKLAEQSVRKIGSRNRAPRMDHLMFGGFSRALRRRLRRRRGNELADSHRFAWLTRDAAVVENYAGDPYCGGVCTASFYRDLIGGTLEVSTESHALSVSKSVPLLLISGEMDPVGGFGKGPQQALAMYRRAGVKDLTLKLYPEARHELVQETNRDQVLADVWEWIAGRFRKGGDG